MLVDLTMRSFSYIAVLASGLCLAGAANSLAAEAWTLQSRDGPNGKICSLSTIDRGRALSISLSHVGASTDQGVVGILFKDASLVKPGTKTLATLEFDNGTNERRRLEASPGEPLLIPIFASDLDGVFRAFSESRTLKVTTRYGSTSFSLDGMADRIPALRECAGS